MHLEAARLHMPPMTNCFHVWTSFTRILVSFAVCLDQVQRKLQMQIEEQGKQLQRMFDEQLHANKNILKNQDIEIMFSDEQSKDSENDLVPPALDSQTSYFGSKIS